MKSISLLIATALCAVCAAAQTRQIAVGSSSPTNITTTVQANWVTVKQLADTPTSFYVFDPRINSGTRQQVQAGASYTFSAGGDGFFPVGSQVGQIQLASGSGVFVITENSIGGNPNPSNNSTSSIPGFAGTVTYTGDHTASEDDLNKLVIMNCATTCTYLLPNPVPASVWTGSVQSVGSTPANVEWDTGTTVNGISYSSLIQVPPTLQGQVIVTFYADSAINTAYYMKASDSNFDNYGTQMNGSADITVGSAPTLLLTTGTNLKTPWETGGTANAFNHDMCARFSVEVTYSGVTAGTLVFYTSLWGNTSSNPTMVNTVPIPANMGTQTFTFSGACAFKANVAPGSHLAATVYAATSLTGVVAKYQDVTVTTAIASWLDGTIE